MYCPKCGYQNNDNTDKCFQCSEIFPKEEKSEKVISVQCTPVKIETYLIHSILCTLFCCIPTGIAALFYSSKADSAAIKGNIAVAKIAAEKSKRWCLISFVLGIVGPIITIIILVIVFAILGISLANH